jgi:hypothetical protein
MPQITGRLYTARGRTETIVAQEAWDLTSTAPMQLVTSTMIVMIAADSLCGRTSKALTLNCKLAINSFATQ